MRVALAQIDCTTGDRQVNLEKISDYILLASKENADVIVFPELSDTGYGKKAVQSSASVWSDKNSSFARLTELASKYSLIVVAGLAERVGDEIFNSMAVVSHSGNLLAKYRKIHLFTPTPASENEYTKSGAELVSAEIAEEEWGLSICYDLRFPELYRSYAISGAKILLNIAAWPEARTEHWNCLARARAIENQCFFVAVNRCGVDGELSLAGYSSVYSPNGEIVNRAGKENEELLVVDLDIAQVEQVRSSIPSLDSRRKDLFT